VRPLTVDEIRAREFVEEKRRWNFAPWADHMAFSDSIFAELVGRLNNAVLQVDPQAPFGLTLAGTPAAYGGYDWSKLAEHVFWVEGPPLTLAIFRDLASGDDRRYISTAVSVTADREPEMRFQFWRGVAEDARGAVLRSAERSGTTTTATPLADDLTLMDGGIGRLLSDASRAPAAVGIVYSHTSLQAHWILDSRANSDWMDRTPQYERKHSSGLLSLDVWTRILDDIGVPYEFVSAPELGTDRFRNRHFKVLILPEVLAVSARQARALAAFVTTGGVLVADSRAGILNEHLVEGESGLLDGLFGVKRRGHECFELNGAYTPAITEPATLRRPPKGLEALASGLAPEVVKIVEPNVRADNGDALARVDRTSAVIVNRTGAGLTVYLNISLWSYLDARWDGGGEKIRTLVGAILQHAGVGPAVQTYVEGLFLPITIKRILSSGPLSYAIILLDRKPSVEQPGGEVEAETEEAAGEEAPAPEQPARAQTLVLSAAFPQAAYAYDMVSGEYLGVGSTVVLSLRADRPALLALLPYRVRRLNAQLSAEQRTMVFSATVVPEDARARPGTHVIRVELVDPKGEPRTEYTSTFFALEGRLTGRIPIGLTESGGAWTVNFTDVASAAKATATVVIQ